MNIAVIEQEDMRLLSETSPEGFRLFQPEKIQAGRGCLLQIYPARPSAEIIRLKDARSLIGRDPSCEITLDDRAVSRSHAAVEADADGYVLVDCDSTNGTYVDDRRVRDRQRLHGGELLRMGGTILKFMSAIDEEAQYHAVVHELMTKDPLTNAFNRAYLLPALEQRLTHCRRTAACLSVILLDIDYFKQVNDQHGHLAGDEVLRIFSERIRHGLRPGDLLARFGGEEFVVVAPDTPPESAQQLAERLRQAVAAPAFQTQAGPLNVTCSLGLAWTDGRLLTTVDQLLSSADQALYQAKQSGRNVVCGPLAAGSHSAR